MSDALWPGSNPDSDPVPVPIDFADDGQAIYAEGDLPDYMERLYPHRRYRNGRLQVSVDGECWIAGGDSLAADVMNSGDPEDSDEPLDPPVYVTVRAPLPITFGTVIEALHEAYKRSGGYIHIGSDGAVGLYRCARDIPQGGLPVNGLRGIIHITPNGYIAVCRLRMDGKTDSESYPARLKED